MLIPVAPRSWRASTFLAVAITRHPIRVTSAGQKLVDENDTPRLWNSKAKAWPIPPGVQLELRINYPGCI